MSFSRGAFRLWVVLSLLWACIFGPIAVINLVKGAAAARQELDLRQEQGLACPPEIQARVDRPGDILPEMSDRERENCTCPVFGEEPKAVATRPWYVWKVCTLHSEAVLSRGQGEAVAFVAVCIPLTLLAIGLALRWVIMGFH